MRVEKLVDALSHPVLKIAIASKGFQEINLNVKIQEYVDTLVVIKHVEKYMVIAREHAVILE